MPAPPYKLRPIAAADDAAVEHAIRAVLTEFGANRPGFAWADPELGRLSTVYHAGAEPPAAYWVVEHDTLGIVGGGGYAQLGGEAAGLCELQKMYLLPQARGLGAGRALIERCIEDAAARGYTRMYLETLRSMTAAQALYRSVGFKPLAGPLGATGHGGCDCWFARNLQGSGG